MQVSIAGEKKKKKKNHLVQFPTLRQDGIVGQENTNHFWQMSVSSDGESIDPLGYQGLSFNNREADFFPSVYLLHLLCWTYLLSPPPRAMQNKGSLSPCQPPFWLKSFLPCCKSGFSWDSALSPTTLLCVSCFLSFCLLLFFQRSLRCTFMHLWKSNAGCAISAAASLASLATSDRTGLSYLTHSISRNASKEDTHLFFYHDIVLTYV